MLSPGFLESESGFKGACSMVTRTPCRMLCWSYGKPTVVENMRNSRIRERKERSKDFQGFGRIATDEDGRFSFATIRPGPVPGPDGKTQAPHIAVSVFARGLLRRLVTRIYFSDEASNADDFVLNLVEPARRGTLMAQNVAGQSGAFEWDVLLQGDDETVFFDIGL